MNTRPEVEYVGEDSAWTAAVRDREQAKDEGTVAKPEGDRRADRVSVDPLRATDRYRLVLPLDLPI